MSEEKKSIEVIEDTNEIRYSAFSLDTGEVLICVNAREQTGYIEAEIAFTLTILPDQKMYVAIFSDSAFFHGPIQVDTRHIVARFSNLYLDDLRKQFDDKVVEVREVRMQRQSSLILPSSASGKLIIP